jgi:hypothetical protein
MSKNIINQRQTVYMVNHLHQAYLQKMYKVHNFLKNKTLNKNIDCLNFTLLGTCNEFTPKHTFSKFFKNQNLKILKTFSLNRK